MNYKEFAAWCRQRMRDGQWDHNTAMICGIVLKDVEKRPFWQRKRRFDRLKTAYGVEEMVIEVQQKA